MSHVAVTLLCCSCCCCCCYGTALHVDEFWSAGALSVVVCHIVDVQQTSDITNAKLGSRWVWWTVRHKLISVVLSAEHASTKTAVLRSLVIVMYSLCFLFDLHNHEAFCDGYFCFVYILYSRYLLWCAAKQLKVDLTLKCVNLWARNCAAYGVLVSGSISCEL